MKTVKTYKYKLRNLSATQTNQLNSWIGSCRFLYNLSLDTAQFIYQTSQKGMSTYDLSNQIPIWKREFQFLKEVPSQSLQDVCERLGKAYQSFFKGGGFPKFAKKDIYNSITLKAIKQGEYGRFVLPKLGEVKTFYSRTIPKDAKLKRATIIKESNGYFICIMFEQELLPSIPKSENQVIGIDWGVAHFLTLSNGNQIANPRLYQVYQKQLRIEQRSLARKKKRSKNFYKQAKKLGKLHAKIARVRNDFQHKLSHDLVQRFDLIGIENLKIKNMSKSAKGNAEEHGKNVNAKSGLNRAIIDTAPSMFFEKLQYKCQWQGKELIKVDAKHTSQTCYSCGHKSKENRKTQAKFECVKCGHIENADINGAKNILARAIASSCKRGALARA